MHLRKGLPIKYCFKSVQRNKVVKDLFFGFLRLKKVILRLLFAVVKWKEYLHYAPAVCGRNTSALTDPRLVFCFALSKTLLLFYVMDLCNWNRGYLLGTQRAELCETPRDEPYNTYVSRETRSDLLLNGAVIVKTERNAPTLTNYLRSAQTRREMFLQNGMKIKSHKVIGSHKEIEGHKNSNTWGQTKYPCDSFKKSEMFLGWTFYWNNKKDDDEIRLHKTWIIKESILCNQKINYEEECDSEVKTNVIRKIC